MCPWNFLFDKKYTFFALDHTASRYLKTQLFSQSTSLLSLPWLISCNSAYNKLHTSILQILCVSLEFLLSLIPIYRRFSFCAFSSSLLATPPPLHLTVVEGSDAWRHTLWRGDVARMTPWRPPGQPASARFLHRCPWWDMCNDWCSHHSISVNYP